MARMRGFLLMLAVFVVSGIAVIGMTIIYVIAIPASLIGLLLLIIWASIAFQPTPPHLNDRSQSVLVETAFASLGPSSEIVDTFEDAVNDTVFVLGRFDKLGSSMSAWITTADTETTRPLVLDEKAARADAIAAFGENVVAVAVNTPIGRWTEGSPSRPELDRYSGEWARSRAFYRYPDTPQAVAHIRAYDMTGQFLWEYAPFDMRESRLLDITTLSDRFVAVGYQVDANETTSIASLVELGPDGAHISTRRLQIPAPQPFTSHWATAVASGSHGQIILAGRAVLAQTASVGRRPVRPFFAILDKDGKVMEAHWPNETIPHTYGTSRRSNSVTNVALHTAPEGIYLATYSRRIAESGWIHHYGYDGTLRWSRYLSRAINDDLTYQLSPTSIAGSTETGLFVGGFQRSKGKINLWVGRLSTNGELESFQIYGQHAYEERLKSLHVSADRAHILGFANRRGRYSSSMPVTYRGWQFTFDRNGGLSREDIDKMITDGKER